MSNMVSQSDSSSVRKGNDALRAHVKFFDRDNDGIIWPSDTYNGFREIGFGVFLSVVSMIIIHTSFSWLTWKTLLPDPFFRLTVDNMHKAKHGSDTASYTTAGDFDQERFNYMFDRYSSPPHTYLSFAEGVKMVAGNRNPWDFFGWFAAVFEWLATYIMLWPADGRMKRDDVQAVYDGSIFYKLSGKQKSQ